MPYYSLAPVYLTEIYKMTSPIPRFISYFLLTISANSGLSFAEPTPGPKTKIVAYNIITLGAKRNSFVGLTVHHPVVKQGVLSSATSSSVTVEGINFVNLLGEPGPAANLYILELANGTIQEISAWDANGLLKTASDISGQVVAGTTPFTLRKAATISDIFGVDNSAGLAPDRGDQLNQDFIHVQGPDGTTTSIYYYDDGNAAVRGWYDDQGERASRFPLIYADGFYIKRAGDTPLKLVTAGEVKLTPTASVLLPGFNYVSSVAPVNLTLESSNLHTFLSPDSTGDYDANGVDQVYLPQTNGSFIVAYYYNDGDTKGWYDTTGNAAGSYALEGGFLIRNRGAAKPYTLSVPASYVENR